MEPFERQLKNSKSGSGTLGRRRAQGQRVDGIKTKIKPQTGASTPLQLSGACAHVLYVPRPAHQTRCIYRFYSKPFSQQI